MTDFLYGFIHLNEEEKKKRGVNSMLVIVVKQLFNAQQWIPEEYHPDVYQDIQDVIDKYNITREAGSKFTHATKTPDEIKTNLEMEPNFSHTTRVEWFFDNTIPITLPINIESTDVYHDKDGQKIALNDFIEMCFSGATIDYDGVAKEVLRYDKVIADEVFHPSDLHFGIREQLETIQKEHGPLYVVWYEK